MKLHFVFGEGRAEALLHFKPLGRSGGHRRPEFEPAALARTFGVIESDVGFALEQFGGGTGAKQPDADACADKDLVLVDFKWAGERGPQFVGDRDAIGFGGEDGELIAAEARQQHARFEARLEPHAHAFQDAASERMAQHAVDEMEAVEVDTEQSGRGNTAIGRRQVLGEQALEGGTSK